MKLVVVSAHPDDEVLGAGGTLLRHRDVGDEIFWIIATDVFTADGFSEERVESRKAEVKSVADRLNAKVYQLGYSTMSLTGVDQNSMIPKISDLFSQIQPERIYVMNRSDAHSDHRIVFNAVMACTKSFRYASLREVFMYECISETEFAPALAENVFLPNTFIDISAYMEEKMDIMKIYESELGAHPFPRSESNIRALATFRGATCGVEFAEAFQLIKSYRFEKL